MHPAPSVILFTAASGLGFGLLFFLGIGRPDVTGTSAFIFFFLGYALAVGGLLASTFHLGNPKNALKAFSQWRTSWLSREGILAVVALSVMGIYAAAAIFLNIQIPVIGMIGALLCLATVGSTSMIYAQLKTIPRWNHWLTPVLFFLFALTGGAMLSNQIWLAKYLMIALIIVQVAYWAIGDGLFKAAGSTMETATGLGHIGKVRQFEPPHTGDNYLLREMVHVVGRKHAAKLRIISLITLGIIPLGMMFFIPKMGHAWGAVMLLSHIVGLGVARWLFFAQAEHVVGLYYGKR
ncbi:dibenzothiophene desulfurase [Amylibacter kogurei]|uniref:Dibenzothiophene desulfurase n=1 Tax=Paramylibacter kogurei TaxID=1889778 RepID=A0A2G5K648_9RHOB|nr:DmsC/YnfH family molybdoenzyme membrane anchor subunit [Amylibacter kogurei]PIB25001.1 dibenzothiophene desulfurase [Amylibacter kogurei]